MCTPCTLPLDLPLMYPYYIKVKFKCVNSSYMRSKSSFKTELYLRVILGPRGGQLGGEKQQGKFSTMGEGAPGMLLRTNQFHKSFKCLSLNFLCVQSEASIYHAAFVIFLCTGEFTCKLDCSWYLSGSCRSHPKRN